MTLPDSSEDRTRRLSTLLEVGRQMNRITDLDQLLVLIATRVVEAVEADRCSIFLLDEDRDEIWSRLLLSHEAEVRFPRDRGLAGHTIRTGESIHVPDAYADGRFNPDVDRQTGYRTRNILCVPLSNLDDRIIGCFQVVNKLQGDFTSADLEFLQAFAAHAAVAINSARDHDELLQKVKQIETVHQLERILLESEDVNRFIQAVLEKAADAMQARAGALLLRLGDQPARLHLYHRDGEPDPGGLGPGAIRALEKVMDSGAAILVGPETLEEPAGAAPWRASSAIVPLTAGDLEPGRTLGALEVVEKPGSGFSASDLAVLQIFASQVTAAIMRQKLREDRVSQERLATVGHLASTIVHDLRGPMASISGFVQMIRQKELDPARRDRYCTVILGEVARCADMARELLEFARGEKRLDVKETDLAEFFEELAMLLENETRSRDVTLEVTAPQGLVLDVDPDRLKRVFFNLHSNALGVLGPGGRIGIDCRRGEDGVEIRFRDSGPGVPEEIRSRLFDPFVTFGKKNGTGLGLSIVRDIVQGHGGTVCLEDDGQPGTCFLIQMPGR